MVETKQQSVYHKSVCRQEGQGEETASIFLLHQTNDEILRRKDSGPSKNIFFVALGFFFPAGFLRLVKAKVNTQRSCKWMFLPYHGVNENKVRNMLLPAYLEGVVLALV